MKRKALIALIISTCVVVVGCVGLVFWAFAATQVTVKSSLVVSYKPTPQVVCETSATYQKTTDETATPFQTANLVFLYGGPDTTRNIEASSDALELDDTDTYLVTEYTFTNKNDMKTYDLTIRLTDNAVCTNMARKYYFGNDIAELSVSAKKDKIINSGVDNLSLSTQKLVLGYQETGRIYMLLQITPGIVANYTSDSTNLFIFNMTCAERGTEEAYLSKDWKTRIGGELSSAKVTFTKDESKIAGLANSVSVGTNSETNTSAFVPADGMEDVTAYWGDDKTNIVIYSSATIYAPQDCSSLFQEFGEIKFDNFNTSKVTNMSQMFYGCYATSLDLSGFDTSKVTDMSNMFFYCGYLTSLDVSNLNTSNVTNMSSMFFYCGSLTSLDVSNFDTSNVTDMSSMFSICPSLTSLDVSNFDTSKVTSMMGMFQVANKLTSLDLSNFDTSNVTDISYIFDGCRSLTSLNVSNFDTSKVTTMYYMFSSCSSLTSLDVSHFDTSNVEDMSHMFISCSSLTSLDISNFDTSKVTSMYNMFCDCSSLTSLDVSNFNTSNVTEMYGMFHNCSSLTSLDVSNFDTSKVTTMQGMFRELSLTSLNIGNFNLVSCTTFTQMLDGCSALASITLPYNLKSGYTITLPASTYYNGAEGPYSKIGTATSGTTVACSTADTKVTLTKAS